MPDLFTQRSCQFSPDRRYRYELRAIWDAARRPAVFIGLNPSTADEFEDDPTVRRCLDFARRWQAGGLVMLNLFAFRATDPKAMKAAAEPVGGKPNNRAICYAVCDRPQIVVCAWGLHGAHLERCYRVMTMLEVFAAHNRVMCLRLTKEGHPEHPLYLPAAIKPIPFAGYARKPESEVTR